MSSLTRDGHVMSDIVRKSTSECIPAGAPHETQKIASPASLVNNRAEMKQPEVVEKLDARDKMNEKFSVVEGKAFLPNEAQLDGVTSLQYGSSGAGESSKQFNNVGRGRGPAGLWSHHDFIRSSQKMTRSSAMGQSSTSVAKLSTGTSRSGKFNGWAREICRK